MGHEASSAVQAGRTAARLARALEVALATVDLSLSQYRLLMFLDAGDEAASALADKLAVTRPSVTTVVDGLVSRGLVERRQDDQDRRKVGHAITEEGRRTLAAADVAVAERLGQLVAELEPGVREAAYRGLDVWRAGMDAAREKRRARR